MKAPRACVEVVKRPGHRDGYRIRWRQRNPETGKIVKHTGELRYNKPDAETDKKKKNLDLSNAHELSVSKTTKGVLPLSAIFKRWHDSRLANGEIRAGYAREATVAWKAIIEKTCWRTVSDITPDSIDAWVTSKAGRGVKKPHIILRSILNFARDVLRQPVDLDAVRLAPAKSREKEQPPLLTDEQFALIRERAAMFGIHAATIVDHLALFGCRPVDACRMTIARWNSAQRTVVRRAIDTKNKKPVTHPAPPDHAAPLDVCAAGRPRSEALFLHPSGRPWRLNKNMGAGELTDWYWNNVSSQIPVLLPEQRGIYCLKDYAITRMELAGIDDRTKSTFTGIFTLSVYQRYKATNRDRQDDALLRLSKLPQIISVTAQGTLLNSGTDQGTKAAQDAKGDKEKSKKV